MGTNSCTVSVARPDSASKRDMDPNDAPSGTSTFSSVELDDNTVPRVAPKLTIFFSVMGLKCCPVIVISVPGVAVTGEKDLITGFTEVKKLKEPVSDDAKLFVAISL